MEEQIYQYHAEMCQVFSHPKRLEAINVLRDGEMSVSELAQNLGLTVGNLSQQPVNDERASHLAHAERREHGLLPDRQPQTDPVFRHDA